MNESALPVIAGAIFGSILGAAVLAFFFERWPWKR